MIPQPPKPPPFPYTTLFRSRENQALWRPNSDTHTALTDDQGQSYPPIAYDMPESGPRSEEHTSELQSQSNLVCRLLLEKKNKNHRRILTSSHTGTLPRLTPM